MLGVGSDIVEPNLMGKKLDGEKLSKLFSQETVWLLPEKDSLDSSQHPTTSVQSPIFNAEYPTNGVEYSPTNVEYPTTNAEYPTTSAEYLTTSAEFPMVVAQLSTSSTQFSGSKNTQSSTSSTQYPTTNGKFFTGRDQFTTTNDVPSISTQTLTTSPQSTIGGTTHAHFPTTSAPLTSEECKVQLHEMFPNKELPTIEHVMASSTDLEEAINKLLNATDENGK